MIPGRDRAAGAFFRDLEGAVMHFAQTAIERQDGVHAQ
jgi:hypothetical protein